MSIVSCHSPSAKRFDELMQSSIDWGTDKRGFFVEDDWEKEPAPRQVKAMDLRVPESAGRMLAADNQTPRSIHQLLLLGYQAARAHFREFV